MTTKTPTIMVVEDETLLLQAITKKLKLSGLDVISCASGKQAVDYLQSMDQEMPSAIWLDYYLKDMNGLAFMQTLKESAKWSQIPVVVVSNSASPEKVHNMLALGAKKYILKAEYRLDEIIEMMLALIAESGGGSTPPAGSSTQQTDNSTDTTNNAGDAGGQTPTAPPPAQGPAAA